MTTFIGLFASMALLVVAVSAVSDVTEDSHRLKGGRGWRGKPRSAAVNLDVLPQLEQMDNSMGIRTQGRLEAGRESLRQHTTLKPRILPYSVTEYESQLTTNLILSTVGKFDGEKILSSIEPLSQMYVSHGSAPVMAADVDEEEHLETSMVQSEFTTSQPMLKADINQHQKNEISITGKRKTFKPEITKSDRIAPVIVPIEHSKEGIGENNPLVGNSEENSDEDSAERVTESRGGQFKSKENGLQPSIGRTNSVDHNQKQNHASRIEKFSNRNQNNTKTISHSRPLPVVAVNHFKPIQNLQQEDAKQTPAPLVSHENRRKLPPLGLHPKSPWIRKNNAQVSSTPIPADRHIQQKKPQVQANAAPVPALGSNVQPRKTRVDVSATSIPVHGSYVKQSKNIIQVTATSVPGHGSLAQQVKNRVQESATSVPENFPQVQTLQTEIPERLNTIGTDENVSPSKVSDRLNTPPISLKTHTQIVSNNKQTENKKGVTKVNEMSKNGPSIPKGLSIAELTVRPTSNARSTKIKKVKDKVASAKKSNGEVNPKKRTDSDRVDVKPQASSAQLSSRHSGASNAVAIISIGLISFITFLTIMGVYFKKISFSRKRYGQHILLSTEEDDLPLFNRQTNYDNYESPYKSWQDL